MKNCHARSCGFRIAIALQSSYDRSVTSHQRDFLIAAPDRWDEACFAVPTVRALIASGLACGVVCRDSQESFWKTVPNLEVLALPPKAQSKKLALQIGSDWKAVLLWENGWIADAIKSSGIQKRLGPANPKLRKLLTHTLACNTGPLDHRVRFYLAAIEELGVHTSNPEFFVPSRIGIESVPAAVLLCPDSDFGPSHEWKQVGWYQLGKLLLDGKFRVTIAGVDGGRGLGGRLAADLGVQVEFFEASPLAEALPLLAVHGLCVAADGSIPHLASHVGATCVTLFGPNDPGWRRPLGRRHGVVRRHVECAPCFHAKCPMDLRCQNELTVEDVWMAVSRIHPMGS
jgi:ADP-heptose:LPS heptosyltransferase